MLRFQRPRASGAILIALLLTLVTALLGVAQAESFPTVTLTSTVEERYTAGVDTITAKFNVTLNGYAVESFSNDKATLTLTKDGSNPYVIMFKNVKADGSDVKGTMTFLSLDGNEATVTARSLASFDAVLLAEGYMQGSKGVDNVLSSSKFRWSLPTLKAEYDYSNDNPLELKKGQVYNPFDDEQNVTFTVDGQKYGAPGDIAELNKMSCWVGYDQTNITCDWDKTQFAAIYQSENDRRIALCGKLFSNDDKECIDDEVFDIPAVVLDESFSDNPPVAITLYDMGNNPIGGNSRPLVVGSEGPVYVKAVAESLDGYSFGVVIDEESVICEQDIESIDVNDFLSANGAQITFKGNYAGFTIVSVKIYDSNGAIVAADAMRFRVGPGNGIGDIVNPNIKWQNMVGVETVSPTYVGSNGAGDAELNIFSRLSDEDSVAEPVTVNITEGAFDTFNLVGPEFNPILMKFGEPREIYLTLYGGSNNVMTKIDVKNADYTPVFYDQGGSMHWDGDGWTIGIDDERGQVVLTIPAIDDPDPNKVDYDHFEVCVDLHRNDRDDLDDYYWSSEVSVVEGETTSEINGFRVIPGKGAYDKLPVFTESGDYSFYFEAVDENGNRVDKINLDDKHEASFGYFVNDDEFDNEDDYDVPIISSDDDGINVVKDDDGKDVLKITFHLDKKGLCNGMRTMNDMFIFGRYATWYENGDDSDWVTTAELDNVHFRFYTPDGNETVPTGADVWIWAGGDNSRMSAIPLKATYDVGYELFTDDEDIEFYSGATLEHEYYDFDKDVWVTASRSEQNGVDYPGKFTNDECFYAMKEGRIRAKLTVRDADGNVAFTKYSYRNQHRRHRYAEGHGYEEGRKQS